jgi:enoyl-CoA hydratase/carnithine racemase
MSEAPSILVEDDAGCRVITLNRPARRNALGTASMQQLEAALRSADADPDVRAVVLTGAPPAFCAGSDLKELAGLSVPEMAEHEANTAASVRSIAKLSVPVVAAVEGYALGGGCILALACDIVVGARNVRWALPEVANGWLPPWGLGVLLARTGMVRAQALTWGAFECDGTEALRLGLADQLCESGQAVGTALAMARRLATLPPHAVASTKRFYQSLCAGSHARLDDQASEIFANDARSEHATSVLARFIEFK